MSNQQARCRCGENRDGAVVGSDVPAVIGKRGAVEENL